MTTAQWLYIALLSTYVALFVAFSRMFYWKHYAEKNYYERRPAHLSEDAIAELAHQNGKEIPYISVFVPARNEADVIEKTIEHLSHLRYSPEHYEILIVTDEKESQAAAEERNQISASLIQFLTSETPWSGDAKYEAVLTSLLSRLALDEAELAERTASPHFSVRHLLTLAPHDRQEILQSVALALIDGKGKIDRSQIHEAIRRRLPLAPLAEVNRLYPIFLSLAIPAVMASANLKREHQDRLVARMMTEAAQARQPLTEKVLTALSDTVSHRIVRRVHATSADRLTVWLEEACRDALPTTQEIVERKRREFANLRNLSAVKHVIVPWDFDGHVDGVCTGEFVPSTKGRALNYAFRFADDRSTMWAFYDAESRPDSDTLLYVAWRRLTVGNQFQIAQGPVYQIRNFWKTSPLCKIAGLYQAISHEWQIAYLLRTIPFIGGTNIFAAKDLIQKIGGFDNTVLTEDMELGARAWLVGDAWPDFLPYASSEQTPPTFKAFFRQRLRWGSGYLQVYDKIKADRSLPEHKTRPLLRTYWWKGHFSWVLFQVVALLPFVVIILRLNHLLDHTIAPAYINAIFLLLGPFYIAFTIYCFFHYYQHMDEAPTSTRVAGFAQLFVLPVSAFFLPVPYSSALVLKWMGRMPTGWVKTPRTKE